MTSYREFVKEQFQHKPAGTSASEWMKEIAQKWHEHKGGGQVKPVITEDAKNQCVFEWYCHYQSKKTGKVGKFGPIDKMPDAYKCQRGTKRKVATFCLD